MDSIDYYHYLDGWRADGKLNYLLVECGWSVARRANIKVMGDGCKRFPHSGPPCEELISTNFHPTSILRILREITPRQEYHSISHRLRSLLGRGGRKRKWLVGRNQEYESLRTSFVEKERFQSCEVSGKIIELRKQQQACFEMLQNFLTPFTILNGDNMDCDPEGAICCRHKTWKLQQDTVQTIPGSSSCWLLLGYLTYTAQTMNRAHNLKPSTEDSDKSSISTGEFRHA